jgi:cyanate permease
MVVFAVVALVTLVLFGWLVHPNDQHVATAAATEPARLGALFADRRLVLLYVLAFLGLGVFNGLTTWLEQILAPHGINADQAGLIGGALIGGGILGAVAIPTLSDLSKRRKPFVILCAGAALATIHPLCSGAHYHVLLWLAGLHGFFFLPAFALLLEMCAQLAGAHAAGSATSILMMAGNLGGVVVSFAMALIKGPGSDYGPAVWLMVALLLATTLLTLLAPETHVQRRDDGLV